MRLILLLLALIAVAGCDRQKAADQQGEPAAEAPGAPVKGVDRSHKGEAAPDSVFKDPDGGDITLADFHGVPVLVNLWATWCAPCVQELPTLNRLALAHNEEGTLGVIAVSQDMGDQAKVVAFLDKLRADALGAYQDPKMALSSALGANVMPTTILYDSDGREVWRYVGDLDWSSAEAARLLGELAGAKKPS